ncbi:molybdopterin cofactor-binding domain-containing protein [Sphingobacterium sp.]|uniref:xanthine dehydrogenase family protein molybdopterin-binding subunit n=1 Tax=Sphingobacterium sp. TaxID=341027 RepID=UPI002896FA0A|nr:molybdopterin cofactor-binding domain-containing protein [Sphingobacterium sp.]
MKILTRFQKSKSEAVASEVFSVSRRDFLKMGGLLTGGLVLGVSLFSCDNKGKKISTLAPNVYLNIDSDGTVTIIAHRSEMGQGIRTSLPMIVADELGADWSKVRIVQAEGDKKYGDQNTDGSYSVRMFYKPMREAGAIAKLMLMKAAAEQWQVPVEECDTEQGQVIHKSSDKKLNFGDLVDAAQVLKVPDVAGVKLKDKGKFTMIGKETPPIVDLQDIVTGKAIFGIDSEIEGMKIAVIKRCPVVGGSVKRVDDSKTRNVPGVIKVVTIEGAGLPTPIKKPLSGVAVIAENTWAAIKGRDLLEVEWDLGPNATYDSAVQIAKLKEEIKKTGTVRRQRGDFEAARANAKTVIEHTYVTPYLAHATLEPPCALAVVKNGTCEVWACTQNPQGAKDALAEELGIPADQVKVNVTLLGGGFGRKSKPDFIIEAAILAKETGLPIKVQWTREDDIHHDFYHALSVQRIVATIDRENKVSGWAHHIANPSMSSSDDISAVQPNDGELMLGASDFPYDIPALKIETHDAKSHLRIGWLRSVRNIPQVFAAATMLDEIAEARGMDPIANAIELLGVDRSITFEQEMVNNTTYPNYGENIADYPWETARFKNVIQRVAKESGWGKTMQKGSALGFAAHRSFLTYVACVVEVRLDEHNKITIPNVYYTVDCGMAVNVDRIKSQFEGGAQFAASLALKSAITVKNGQVEQNNFDGYQIIRMPESPSRIHVHIVESDAKPTGVGEPPVPPFTPALCNAIYAITGKRIYSLPIDLAQ